MQNPTCRLRCAAFTCVIIIAFLRSAGAAAEDAVDLRDIHWKYIRYPRLVLAGESDPNVEFMISCGENLGAPKPGHFRFDILWCGAAVAQSPQGLVESKPPRALAEPKKIIVRLHLPEGKVVEPNNENYPGWDGAGSSLGMTYSRMYLFPWARNRLDEAWIEVRLPAQTYWVEVPYGFTRNPTDPRPPTERDRGNPVFATAMKNLPQNDRIVPWLQVEYDLGEIQNHWKLLPNVANPFRAGIDLTLYHEPDSGSWRLDAPSTAVAIKTADGTSNEGSKIASRENGLLERIDTFRIGADGCGDKAREWGTIIARVDDKSFGFVVPSSLFKYVHGTSDALHKQLLPRAPRVGTDQLFYLLLKASD